MTISPLTPSNTPTVASSTLPSSIKDNPGVIGQGHHAAKPLTQAAPPPLEEVQKAAATLNRLAAIHNTSVSFNIDDSSGKTIITVMDTDDNTVIRQIPTKEALALSQDSNVQHGVVLKTTA